MAATHPGGGLKTGKMPGHWVLARLGKRVLRPGGMELTRRMLTSLGIGWRPVGDGAASVVWAVTLSDDRPTGDFFRDGKHLPW